ncbi:MAG TPA: hypothetical protein VML55_25670, partial [Planctomycetaceae bacterium]|nr:hypothetical protein [Planctomycetaceae bacterium]
DGAGQGPGRGGGGGSGAGGGGPSGGGGRQPDFEPGSQDYDSGPPGDYGPPGEPPSDEVPF